MDHMQRAIELALKGRGSVDPNPLVGAVIVKNGKIIGEGWHKKFGENHAEINALNSLKETAEGSEMYVTLEPCAHYGKTPPCAVALAGSGIKKVYIGMTDPNPLVSGKGIEILRSSGIEAETGILEAQCRDINQPFIKYITKKTPYVVMKNAVSLDGKIATYTGNSRWISCEESREEAHKFRNALMGIMVGVNTVLSDDPMLTCRVENGRDPYRIVVDSSLRTPLTSKVIGTDGKCIIATINSDNETIKKYIEKGVDVIVCKDEGGRVDLKELMKKLGEKGINSVLLEGGGELNFSALQRGIVDKAIIYISPKIIGGKTAKTAVEGQGFPLLEESIVFNEYTYRQLGCDMVFEGYLRRY